MYTLFELKNILNFIDIFILFYSIIFLDIKYIFFIDINFYFNPFYCCLIYRFKIVFN